MSNARRAILAESRRDALARWEAKLGSWMQLWAIIVVGHFIAKLLLPAIAWQYIAWVAAGQTVLLIAILVTTIAKWRAELSRRRWEAEFQAEQE